ncbi:fungal-trans domain-containing protein [Favolaschia claudopus]|uniref:Fungal-trans domain-containing protein n=1 Tax=Favolaschia claudopus TaxID=2862362 RepID=A0AAW0C4K1_9AGAR
MTSGDEGRAASPSHADVRTQTGKTQRSCDFCRKRKSDGPTKPETSCAHCLEFGLSCTYLQPIKKRGPKTTKKITMEEMKKENEMLRAQLKSLSVCAICSQKLHDKAPEPKTVAISTSSELDEAEDNEASDLAHRFSQFGLGSTRSRYFGSASNFALANSAIMMKEKYMGRPTTFPFRRRMFWDTLPWEEETLYRRPQYVYPPSDLMASLVTIYFDTVHPTHPIIHRPSFERALAEGLHLTDPDFGGTLLAVLSLASRYTNDCRVFVNMDSTASLSAGWKFAIQVQLMPRIFEPTLYEIQTYALLSLFLFGSSVPQASWIYIGLGIRCLQQRGEHRKKPDASKSNLEAELWKRSFCMNLVVPLSSSLLLTGDRYDVEFPVEIDDEYLDKGWDQPTGKPSQLSYFVCHVRLCRILSDAMRRLYGPKREKVLLGWNGPEWEQRIVTEFDSTMNDFLDLIPAHLRWDPEHPPEDCAFFDQSASLYITYNYVLTAIHRPFIQKRSTLTATSLSVCAAAARSIIQTADIWFRRFQRLPLSGFTNPLFVSGVILILYTLGNRRAGLPMAKNKDLVRVATAMKILKFAESKMQPAGRLWELLQELGSLEKPLPLELSSTNESIVANPPLTFTPQPVKPNSPHAVRPGMSVEDLLVDADPSNSMHTFMDEELMSMWMAAPCNAMNLEPWNTYLENALMDSTQFMDSNWAQSLEEH